MGSVENSRKRRGSGKSGWDVLKTVWKRWRKKVNGNSGWDKLKTVGSGGNVVIVGGRQVYKDKIPRWYWVGRVLNSREKVEVERMW